MPRRGGEAVSDDGLAALIEAAGLPEAPPDLGNFRPTGLSGTAAEGEPSDPADSDVPPASEPAGPPSVPEPDDEGEAPPAPDPVAERLARIERENEFLRLAMQRPAAPADPPPPSTPQEAAALIDRFLGGYTVNPEDVETALRDPARGAEMLRGLMRAAAAAGAGMALTQARSEYNQVETRKAESQNLRTLMYSQHPELEPYADQVLVEAQRLWGEYANPDGTCRLPANELVAETARRTHAKLQSWGLKQPATEKRTRSKVTRMRPAFAEGGSGAGATQRQSLSQLEKDIFQLVNAR